MICLRCKKHQATKGKVCLVCWGPYKQMQARMTFWTWLRSDKKVSLITLIQQRNKDELSET